MNDDLSLVNKIKNDGWSNLLSGLGTVADKRNYTKANINGIASDNELEAIYIDDGLGAKIVDLIVDDMFKHGWNYIFPNENEEIENKTYLYNNVYEDIRLVKALSQAFKWSRLYGGAIIILGCLDGQSLDMPLVNTRIRKFEDLKVVARGNIEFNDFIYQDNPAKERFGEVEYYFVNFKINDTVKKIKIHYSRVIELHGVEVPRGAGNKIPQEYRYWGLSVLQRVKDRLGDLSGIMGSVSNLVQELTVGKYKFNNLADILSLPDGNNLIKNRIQLMDLMKSSFHSLYMDKEDDYIRDTLSLGGVSDIIYQFFTIISASTGYPLTKLFGVSPAGLNSSGDSDTYSYYDVVRSKQELELKPVLHRINSIISEWKKLPMPMVEFNPLEQMTDKEMAEVEERKANAEKTKAETYEKYIEMGIMEPYMVEKLEFGETLKNIKHIRFYQK